MDIINSISFWNLKCQNIETNECNFSGQDLPDPNRTQQVFGIPNYIDKSALIINRTWPNALEPIDSTDPFWSNRMDLTKLTEQLVWISLVQARPMGTNRSTWLSPPWVNLADTIGVLPRPAEDWPDWHWWRHPNMDGFIRSVWWWCQQAEQRSLHMIKTHERVCLGAWKRVFHAWERVSERPDACWHVLACELSCYLLIESPAHWWCMKAPMMSKSLLFYPYIVLNWTLDLLVCSLWFFTYETSVFG